MTVAAISGISTSWWEAATPRSAASARSAPHVHAPRGKRGTMRSGFSLQARCEPGDPGCLPGFRLPRCGLPSGGVRPGRSSIDGGSEELPEFRDAARSSLASRSSSSATRVVSAAFCAASIAMSCPCSAISASRAPSSGLTITDRHHPVTSSVINATH